jgi:hypothetical protein
MCSIQLRTNINLKAQLMKTQIKKTCFLHFTNVPYLLRTIKKKKQ